MSDIHSHAATDGDADTSATDDPTAISRRFRGFLPVVVDVETGGFNHATDALLEIAAQPIVMDSWGRMSPGKLVSTHVEPFEGANLEPKALEITGIVVDHPFRNALPEREALNLIFRHVRQSLRASGFQRAILVGHNAAFDLNFVNAAVTRTSHKRNPFHPFSTLDTVTLSALAFGQTVLSRSVMAAGLPWNADEAHSAVYDTERTAELFCHIHNQWQEGGLHTAGNS